MGIYRISMRRFQPGTQYTVSFPLNGSATDNPAKHALRRDLDERIGIDAEKVYDMSMDYLYLLEFFFLIPFSLASSDGPDPNVNSDFLMSMPPCYPKTRSTNSEPEHLTL